MKNEMYYVQIDNGQEKEEIRLKSESEFNCFKEALTDILNNENECSFLEQVNKFTNVIYSVGYLKKCKFTFQKPLCK